MEKDKKELKDLDNGPKKVGVRPTQIHPLSPIEIFMAFDNEENYSLSYQELRYYCPCAVCVDEHTGERVIQRSQIRQDIRPQAVQPVGQYAIQITWNDHHSTGIYHFDRLYLLCKDLGKKLPAPPLENSKS